MQLDWLDGEMSDQCGQDHHHANLSQRQDSKKEKRTKGIYGLSGSISSESLDLQSFLVNKLAQQLIRDGSIKSKLIWNPVTTLAGRSLFQLQRSELFIKDQDYGSWPTPIFSDGRGSAGKDKKELPNIAKMADWATPNTMDYLPQRSEEAMKKIVNGARKGRTFPSNLREQVDPVAQAAYAIWPTVTAQDNIQMVGQYNQKTGTTLGGAVRQCNAKMEKQGSSLLNPLFSLWLMGYPTEWGSCVVQGTQLSLK